MKILALDHLQLAMPTGREAEARRFYGDLLGMTEVAKPAPLVVRGGCWFAIPGLQVHLGVEKDFAPARKAHPAFVVGDLEALRQRLFDAGMSITPDQTLPNLRRFYTADPFGNRIEFIQQEKG